MATINRSAPRPTILRPRQRPSLWLRIALVLTLALALATLIATRSPDRAYEEQLVNLALRQTHGARLHASTEGTSEIKALLLDYDPELAFKAELALEKYGDDARDVLARFGDDPPFQAVLRQYGETTIPVVAYFVTHDIASIRLIYLAQQTSDSALAAAQESWTRFWNKDEVPERAPAPEPSTYGPDLRGQQAITMILEDGHPFLGQFVVNAQGKADWVQTERAAQAVKSLFLSGAINLERKYKSGTPLKPADVVSAGVDVFIFVGAFKALKFLRASQQVRAVGVMKRTQLLGAPLLRTSTLGRAAMKYGVAAGAAYLVVRHPSLLTSAFVTLGQRLGLSPLMAKTLGWGVLLTVLLVPLLSFLVLALRVAAALFTGAGRGLQWVLGMLGWRSARAV